MFYSTFYGILLPHSNSPQIVDILTACNSQCCRGQNFYGFQLVMFYYLPQHK